MKLFIDDIRDPVDDSWVVARTSEEAIKLIEKEFPSVISFDHDLGGDDTSMIVVHAIIDMWLDRKIKINNDFEFHVHSMNPIGAENIRLTFGRFLKFIGLKSNNNL